MYVIGIPSSQAQLTHLTRTFVRMLSTMRGTRRLCLTSNPFVTCFPSSIRSCTPSSSSCPSSDFLVRILAPSPASIRWFSAKINEVYPANFMSSSSAKTKLIGLLKLVSPETEVHFEEKMEIVNDTTKGYRSQVLIKTKDQFTLAYTGNSVATSKKASQHIVSLCVLNDLVFANAKDSTSSSPPSFLVQQIHQQSMDRYTLPLKDWLAEINEETHDSTEAMIRDMIGTMRINTRRRSKMDPSSIDALRHQLHASKNIDLGNISKCMLALNIYSYEDEGIKELIDVLSSKLSHCEEEMTSFQVRDCMFGLRNMRYLFTLFTLNLFRQ